MWFIKTQKCPCQEDFQVEIPQEITFGAVMICPSQSVGISMLCLRLEHLRANNKALKYELFHDVVKEAVKNTL
jgi:hypothetical protein